MTRDEAVNILLYDNYRPRKVEAMMVLGVDRAEIMIATLRHDEAVRKDWYDRQHGLGKYSGNYEEMGG